MADDKLSSEEAEQYDRQIRLWGLEAQRRLRTARILAIGLGGLSAEVCKDVVLAGVKSLTLIDTQQVIEDDVANRFLCFHEGVSRSESAMSRLQVLNPNVLIKTDNISSVFDIKTSYCKEFDLIFATSCSQSELLHLNEICHSNGIKFICGDTWGYYGYFFTDLQEHTYVIDLPKEGKVEDLTITSKEEPIEYVTVKKSISFCSLKDALSFDWSKKTSRYFRRTPATFFTIQILQSFRDRTGRNPQVSHLEEDQILLSQLRQEVTGRLNVPTDVVNKEFISHCFSELSPVCAIVGGVLAQEIIKAISAKDEPFHNTFLYDGVQSSGIIESLSC